MSKGLTVIAFVFLLPFVVLATLWMAAKRRGTAVLTSVSPGSSQGTQPQGTMRQQSSSAQGTAPSGSGAADIISASAQVIKAAQPIISGYLDSLVQSNADYTTDNTEAAVPADAPIEAPFLDSLNVF